MGGRWQRRAARRCPAVPGVTQCLVRVVTCRWCGLSSGLRSSPSFGRAGTWRCHGLNSAPRALSQPFSGATMEWHDEKAEEGQPQDLLYRARSLLRGRALDLRMDGAAASLAQTLSTNALDLQHIADRLEGEVSVPLPRSVSLSLSACALRGT